MIFSQLSDINVKGLLEEGFKLSHGLAKVRELSQDLISVAAQLNYWY